MKNMAWFTNLDTTKRHELLTLYKSYTPEEYPYYDNYDAIEVPRYADIPYDFDGVMGVPITFLDKYNPDQFEIVGTTESNDPDNHLRIRWYSAQECRDGYFARFGKPGVYDLNASGVVDGVKVFKRIVIRPRYQREFVYDEKKRNAVIDTIRKGFPLNVMYWVITDQETYEVMDGQQRTISFCQYVNGDFSIPVDGHPMAFHNLQKTQQDQI